MSGISVGAVGPAASGISVGEALREAAASVHRYLDETLAVSQLRSGRVSRFDVTSQVPRLVFNRLLDRIERTEQVGLIALAQAGRHAAPRVPPPVIEAVEDAASE